MQPCDAGKRYRSGASAMAVGACIEELGAIGKDDMLSVVPAEARLRDRTRGGREERGIRKRDPARIVAGVGTADAIVDAAEEAAQRTVVFGDMTAVRGQAGRT